MGSPEQLARLAGGLVGLGFVIAAASPFNGVPPRGGSGGLAPAQVEVRVLSAGELEVDPTGTVLQPTPFPAPGERGGPTLAVTVRNITGVPLRLSVRLVGIAPTLDKAAKVRGSVAGAVVINAPLAKAGEWTAPVGRLESGEQSTLRLRFKLLPGISGDAWLGRLDIRQLEIKGVKLSGEAATNTVESVTPDGTTPAQTSPAPTTAPATTPVTPPSPPQAPGPAEEQGRIPEGEHAPPAGGD